jgi:hypothetical protein
MIAIDPRNRAPSGAVTLFHMVAAVQRRLSPVLRLGAAAKMRAQIAKMTPRQRIDIGLPAIDHVRELDQLARILAADRR